MTDSLSGIHHLVDGPDKGSAQPEDIYRSSNGDIWQLIREAASGRILVRHQPNIASGGHPTDMTVEQFLAVGAHGPEHEALQVLLATNAKTV